MRHRIPLPPALGESFHVTDAAVLGLSRWRQDSRDLSRPFPGIRSIAPPRTFAARVECYRPRLRDGHRFCGITAARIWGLPLPWSWRPDEHLEVAVPDDAAPPRTGGVRGRKLRADAAGMRWPTGVPVTDPVVTLFTLAPRLTVRQATVIVDALVTRSGIYPGLCAERPLSSLDDIDARVVQWRRFAGIATVRGARERVESPMETETRLMIVDAGLPEPQVQYVVWHRGRRIAKVDLAYPERRVAIEYEGDGHRTDRRQWREDIRRQRELEESGWTLIRLTADDLRGHGRTRFLSRLCRVLA